MKRLLIVALLLLFVGAGQSLAAWEYGTLPALDPAPDDWNSSMVYVQNDVLTNTLLLYSSGGDVYGWNPETGVSELLVNPNLAATSDNAAGPAGMVLSYDGNTLYFHDNGYPTTYIFQYNFDEENGVSPTTYYKSKISCEGSIYDLAVNPWTDKLWFTSGDYSADNFYLYEVTGSKNKMKAVLRATVPTPLAGSGTGPIIFKGPSTILFGEASYTTGTGTFHLVDSSFGTVLDAEYANFDGGLADAIYGYNNEIYVATGYGYTLDLLSHNTSETVFEPDSPIMGMAFDGTGFYLGETHALSGTVTVAVLSDTETMDLVTPEEGFRYAALPYPEYPFQTWNPSVAYFGNSLIYAGVAEAKDSDPVVDIYSYNLVTGKNEKFVDVDFSDGSTGAAGPSAFTVGSDGYLYFHDNGYPTQYLYKAKLSNTAVSSSLALTNTVQGSIWDMTWNPWTESLWIATAGDTTDDGDSDTFYLYEISQDFTGIEGTGISFPMAHTDEGSGNGPIIFTGKDTLYYGESGWSGFAYFHEVNIKTQSVITDVISFAGGLNAAVYGYDNGIYVSTSDGKAVYQVNPISQTLSLVAQTQYSIGDMTFDGTSFLLSGNDVLSVWQPQLSGVPDDQEPSDYLKIDDADLCVVANASKRYIVGIEGGTNTFVESLKYEDPSTLNTSGRGPYYLPYGLLDFKVKVANVGGTATIVVHFSHAVPKATQWWKWDPIKGWYTFDNATYGDNGFTMTLKIVDGGEGDADGIANGYVTDPGGPGIPEENTGVTETDDTNDCFVRTAGHANNATLALIFGLGLAALVSIRKKVWS